MFEVNKKLWSLNFGCLFACSLVTLVDLGNSAPVLSIFHAYPDFVLDYYPSAVTAIIAVFMSIIMLFIMRKFFNICASEHTFWLVLPMMYFLGLAVFAAQFILLALLFAALPIILTLGCAALYFRLCLVKNNKHSLLSSKVECA